MGLDLRAVADDHDLHVGGVEIFAGGLEQISADFLAIRFEIVVRPALAFTDGGDLWSSPTRTVVESCRLVPSFARRKQRTSPRAWSSS